MYFFNQKRRARRDRGRRARFFAGALARLITNRSKDRRVHVVQPAAPQTCVPLQPHRAAHALHVLASVRISISCLGAGCFMANSWHTMTRQRRTSGTWAATRPRVTSGRMGLEHTDLRVERPSARTGCARTDASRAARGAHSDARAPPSACSPCARSAPCRAVSRHAATHTTGTTVDRPLRDHARRPVVGGAPAQPLAQRERVVRAPVVGAHRDAHLVQLGLRDRARVGARHRGEPRSKQRRLGEHEPAEDAAEGAGSTSRPCRSARALRSLRATTRSSALRAWPPFDQSIRDGRPAPPVPSTGDRPAARRRRRDARPPRSTRRAQGGRAARHAGTDFPAGPRCSRRWSVFLFNTIVPHVEERLRYDTLQSEYDKAQAKPDAVKQNGARFDAILRAAVEAEAVSRAKPGVDAAFVKMRNAICGLYTDATVTEGLGVLYVSSKTARGALDLIFKRLIDAYQNDTKIVTTSEIPLEAMMLR